MLFCLNVDLNGLVLQALKLFKQVMLVIGKNRTFCYQLFSQSLSFLFKSLTASLSFFDIIGRSEEKISIENR